MRGYNLYGFYCLVISLIYTKIFHPNCKIIRLPVSIRNAKHISFGKNFVTGRYCRIDVINKNDINKKIISIGDNCQINDSVHLAATSSLYIGNNVLIASRVFITDHLHGKYTGDDQSHPSLLTKDRELSSNPVIINNNVWIGEGVSILPGVTIGENSIIGANSVVTNDIPDNSIAVGIPAKVIKQFNFELGVWTQVVKK